jgi:HlyD family secretion protein
MKKADINIARTSPVPANTGVIHRPADPTDGVFYLAGTAQWLTLAIFTAIAAAVVAWGVFGRLDYEAKGVGVILRNQGDIFTLQATVTGTVRAIHVAVGDNVKEGDVIAEVHVATLEAAREANERDVELVTQQLAKFRADSADDIRAQTQSIERQISAQNEKIANSEVQLQSLQETLRLLNEELEKGYATRIQVQQVQSQVYQTQQVIADAHSQILNLSAQLQQFTHQRESQVLKLEQQLSDAKSALAQTEANIKQNSIVRAPTSGTVTGIGVAPGGQVTAGTTIVGLAKAGEGLNVLAFFPITQGKAIEPGMSALVSPTYIEQEIYGSLVARVSSITEYVVDNSAIKARIGDSPLVQELISQGSVLQAEVHILPDPNGQSGLKWTSGTGAPVPVRTGAIGEVVVITERIRPIELVVPLVKRWTGIGVPRNG